MLDSLCKFEESTTDDKIQQATQQTLKNCKLEFFIYDKKDNEITHAQSKTKRTKSPVTINISNLKDYFLEPSNAKKSCADS